MLLAGTGLSYYVDRAMGVRYGTDSPLATATITFNDPSLDTATYTDDLKALAGTGKYGWSEVCRLERWAASL